MSETREIKLTIYGNPVTKKNSQRMVYAKGRIIPLPSAKYSAFEKDAKKQLVEQYKGEPIDYPVNLECKYFMQTRRKCDLVNLLEATQDTLIVAKVIADDNFSIVARVDGSEVLYDKENPRTEIVIRELLPFE